MHIWRTGNQTFMNLWIFFILVCCLYWCEMIHGRLGLLDVTIKQDSNLDSRKAFFSQFDFIYFNSKSQSGLLYLKDDQDYSRFFYEASKFVSRVEFKSVEEEEGSVPDYSKFNRQRIRMRSQHSTNQSYILSYPELLNRLVELNRKYAITALYLAGFSFQGRPTFVMKIRTQPWINKPIIFINAGVHAREWASVSTTMLVLSMLLRGYTENDAQTVKLLKNYDVHIMPLVNPDGYAYSHRKDRFWRKNRHWIGNCHGVDINRNFPTGFTKGENQCNTPAYPGNQPISEPETQNIVRYLKKFNGKIDLLLDLHSFGEIWMMPYGHTNSTPDNYEKMFDIALKACDAMEKVRGHRWIIGRIFEVIPYQVNGILLDWVYKEKLARYAYGVELGPSLQSLFEKGLTSYDGFVVTENEIFQSGLEMKSALFAAMEEIVKERLP